MKWGFIEGWSRSRVTARGKLELNIRAGKAPSLENASDCTAGGARFEQQQPNWG